ncbi:hypothetical protein [Mycoplasma suis]|uniref:Uncharacterized protein n=1 Tax=Mycoplasma suis (strain Illinois) TaxID=768700 RepID=F0QQH9_MYCSL|nr:hypothetical protein [Mycoplasma suis]ADX97749.1 hypothetical protein MSU_0205 [Mycoplasma suis str. Illinois]
MLVNLFSGIKIIPVILGITGVVGGGSFGLTTYLINKEQERKSEEVDTRVPVDKPIISGSSGNDSSFQNPSIGKITNEHSPASATQITSAALPDDPDKLDTLSSNIEDHLGVEVMDNEGDDEVGSAETLGGIEDLDSQQKELDKQMKEDYSKAKEGKQIVATYFLREKEYIENEKEGNFQVTCEYWTSFQQEAGKNMTEEDCQQFISENLEISKENKPLKWMKVSEQGIMTIPKQYFSSISVDSSDSSWVREEEKWTLGAEWLCSTTTKRETNEIVISCEEPSVEEKNRYFPQFSWREDIEQNNLHQS